MENIPPDLHRTQGINHLNRVLSYAQFVVQDGVATVHLTAEDWHVVADTLFHMNTPKELLPEAIQEYGIPNENKTIVLKTADMTVEIEII